MIRNFISAGIMMMVLSFLFGCSKSVPIGEIERFDFSYTRGYMANSNIDYCVWLEDGKYIASFKPHGVPEEQALIWEADSAFIERIRQCLRQYKVGHWNGFNKSGGFVLDGDQFSLVVRFQDKTAISAIGYMEWPDHYPEFQKEIERLFEDYAKEKSLSEK